MPAPPLRKVPRCFGRNDGGGGGGDGRERSRYTRDAHLSHDETVANMGHPPSALCANGMGREAGPSASLGMTNKYKGEKQILRCAQNDNV